MLERLCVENACRRWWEGGVQAPSMSWDAWVQHAAASDNPSTRSSPDDYRKRMRAALGYA